jgi:cytochrome P450
MFGYAKAAVHNLTICQLQCNAKPFTFSDGTVLPMGAKVETPSLILHRNPEIYADPGTFDGFRFSRDQSLHTEITLILRFS